MKKIFISLAAALAAAMLVVTVQTSAIYEIEAPIIEEVVEATEPTTTQVTTAELVVTTQTSLETTVAATTQQVTETEVIVPTEELTEVTESESEAELETEPETEEIESYTGGIYSVMTGTWYTGSEGSYGYYCDSVGGLVSGYSVACNSIPGGTIIYIESATAPYINGYYQVADIGGMSADGIDFFYNYGEVPEQFCVDGVISDLYVSIVG